LVLGEKNPFLSFVGALSAKLTYFSVVFPFELKRTEVLLGLINFLRGSFFWGSSEFLGMYT